MEVTPWTSSRPTKAPGSARGQRSIHRPSSSRDGGSRPPLPGVSHPLPIRVSGCGFNGGHPPSTAERLNGAYGGAMTARPATGLASRRTPVGGRPETARSGSAGSAQHAGYNGSAHMSHTSTKRPADLMTETLRVFDFNQVGYSPQSPFVMSCERGGVEFDAEVASIDATQSRFVLRLQYIRGDAWLYKELCQRVLPALRL